MSATCVTFVSQASLGRDLAGELDLTRRLVPVRGCRRVGKRDMVRNDATPRIEVDPETYTVRVDGRVATCEPAARLPLTQLHYLV